ncbi:hypothetical protein [Enterococcus faecium]|uniref:hypothetical protein n=1 Tax=Enterococcus faecium TaxID=1352 RepID=UPI0033906C77
MKFDKILIAGPGSDYGNRLWDDVRNLDRVKFFNSFLNTDNSVLRKLHHAHFSFMLNRKANIPFQSIWNTKMSINKSLFDSKKKYLVIFTDVSAARYSQTLLQSISKMSNVKCVLIFFNTMQKMGSLLKNKISLFDLVYTFDKDDAKIYNFLSFEGMYSRPLYYQSEVEDIKYDLFYIGKASKRLETLIKIAKLFLNNHVKAKFIINGVSSKEIVKLSNATYNKWLSYDDVVKSVLQSKAILEVLDPNQTGVTLRTMEAIVLNKILITNNKNIKNNKYYSPKRIIIFNEAKDINFDWLNDDNKIEYNYGNDYSPINLIQRIEVFFNE